MPQLRKDPITREWVVIAEDRAQRPGEIARPSVRTEQLPEHDPDCPFCPGNEGMTPPELMALRSAGGAGNGPEWSVRVVPNKYPALQIEDDLGRRGQGMYDCMNATGAHEVIIETPVHNQLLSEVSQEHCAEILWACHQRMVDLSGDRRFKYILLFRNHGAAAGASIPHPHSQLIALPIVPSNVAAELEGMAEYAGYRDRCAFCDMAGQEIESGERVVFETETHLVFEPYASRFPFETLILPKAHQPAFTDLRYADMTAVAEALTGTLHRLRICLDDPPYNLALHTLPTNSGRPEDFHWHIQIAPRLTIAAGFEMGAGVYINPTSPEQAAASLRAAVS